MGRAELILVTALAWALAMPAQAQVVLLYSHGDMAEARRVVALLRVAGPVAWDQDLQPGEVWRQAVADRIRRARRVLVLWSAYAAESAEVARELQTAAKCRRILVPLLLDSSAMPAALGEWQAVDWR